MYKCTNDSPSKTIPSLSLSFPALFLFPPLRWIAFSIFVAQTSNRRWERGFWQTRLHNVDGYGVCMEYACSCSCTPQTQHWYGYPGVVTMVWLASLVPMIHCISVSTGGVMAVSPCSSWDFDCRGFSGVRRWLYRRVDTACSVITVLYKVSKYATPYSLRFFSAFFFRVDKLQCMKQCILNSIAD